MAFWSSKRTKTEVADPALEREMERRQAQWDRLQQHLERNPLFHMTTFDGLNWIDPFTAAKIPAPFDYRTTARDHFVNSDHWRSAKTRSPQELRYVQWLHYLTERYWEDERLRLFTTQGNWLNPWTGHLCRSIVAQGGQLHPRLLRDMARSLCVDPKARPDRLKSVASLLEEHPEVVAGAKESDSEVRIDAAGFHMPTGEVSADDRAGTFAGQSDTATYDPGTGVGDTPRAALEPNALDMLGQLEPSPTPSTGSQRVDRVPTTFSVNQAPSDGPRDAVEAQTAPEHRPRVPTDEEEQDLEKAAQVQKQLLGDPPSIPGLAIALAYSPYSAIGGDFYDVIELKDGRYFLIVGDVSGHGIQAALVVQSIIKTLRFVCQYADAPELIDLLVTTNDSVRSDLLKGQFFTCFAAIIDRSAGRTRVRCACAGHHPTIAVNPVGPTYMRQIGSHGMAMGIAGGDTLRRALHIEDHELVPGDTLVVYTDGLCEAMNGDDEEYGHWRARATALAHIDADVETMVETMLGYVDAFTDNRQDDDITILALRVLDTPAEDGTQRFRSGEHLLG